MTTDLLFFALIAFGLIIVIVLIIYLVDRVNKIEKDTQVVANRLSEAQQQANAFKGPYGGLSDKTLWDAMTGTLPEGMSEEIANEIRPRYEAILARHIEILFDEGKQDGQMGATGDPKNPRKINALRGSVESWLPPPIMRTIYQCGVDAAQKPETDAETRASLDEATGRLYAKAQLTLRQPVSLQLMGTPAESAAAEDNPPSAA